MAKDVSKMPLPKLDDLFTTEEERVSANLEKVVDIIAEKREIIFDIIIM